MTPNTLLLYFLLVEFGLLAISVLGLIIYEISQQHPQPFKLPGVHLERLAQIAEQKQNQKPSWLQLLVADFQAIYKITSPEFFTSDNGNILYVTVKGTSNWTPEQITLWLLAHRPEFIQQLEAKDPELFDAVSALLPKVTTAQISVALDKLNILPKYKRTLVVWKLPLVEMPGEEIPNQLIVKEV